jgi:hypothetical protein
MKRTHYVIVAAIVVIAASLAWYFFHSASSPALPLVPEGAGPSGTTTIAALSVSPDALECAITLPDKRSGVAYVSNGKLSALFTAGGYAYLLDTGTALYTWADGTQKGAEISLSDNPQNSIVSAVLTYRCVPWAPDARVFSLPDNVSFVPVSVR